MSISAETPVLSLRLGRGHRPVEPALTAADLDAFRRTAVRDGADVVEAPREVGVSGPATPLGDVLVVFIEPGGFPIPRPGAHDPATLPSLDAWRLQVTRFGVLAAVRRDRPRGTLARVVWTVAACLPLALVPAVGHAAPAGDKAPRTLTPPSIPPLPGGGAPSTDDGATETSDTTDTTDADDATAPAPEADDADTPSAAPEASTTQADDGTLMSSAALRDAAWEGVLGYDVELVLHFDREISGRVTALQPETFTLIDRETGVVRVMKKSSVAQLRVHVPGPVPTKDGSGLLAGGGILTALGAPVFLSGVVFVGLCPSCTYIHVPLLLVGGAALGAGIPMIVRGVRRRQAYNESRSNQWLPQPSISATRNGWSGGLRFRF